MGKFSENFSNFGRSVVMSARNTARFVMLGRPSFKRQRPYKLARRGLHGTVRDELDNKMSEWKTWAGKKGAKSAFATSKIRVTARNTLTSTTGAVPTFVGIGLDEKVQTRLLSTASLWSGVDGKQAEDIFGNRSRTSDLIWRTNKPAIPPPDWEPIAGHTPGVKRSVIGGTKGAITSEHGTRDALRESANQKTLGDMASPNRMGDVAVMASLATIKHMSSPGSELMLAKADVQALPTPRFAAVTGNKDLRTSAHFDEMVMHVHEERERSKWEVASVMNNNTVSHQHLNPLVPPQMRNYLSTYGNDPHKAMEAFRYDLHQSFVAPPVNTHVTSDTEANLQTHSLHQMATLTTTTGRRQRALSDARGLPPVSPVNSRGQ